MAHVTEYDIPWVEKYRPKNINQVIGNVEIIQRLGVIAKEGNMPNILLGGLPGTGKTSSILCVARALLADQYKDAVLELNASDERGIDVVRDDIKTFAKKKIMLPPGCHKIIILDEADHMTGSAQQALRRIMEVYSETTRFALACNSIDSIIEPIQSRCAVLRFRRLSNEQIKKRLCEVLTLENAQYDDAGLDAVIFTADGDMRQALNNSQSTVCGFGVLNADNVYRVCDMPQPHQIKVILEECIQGNNRAAQEALKKLIDSGFSSIDIVTTFFKVVKNYNELEETLQLGLVKIIGTSHIGILNGQDSYLQLSAMIARLCSLRQNNYQSMRGIEN
jgi:replication factor C subunit 2/4